MRVSTIIIYFCYYSVIVFCTIITSLGVISVYWFYFESLDDWRVTVVVPWVSAI